MNIFRNLLLAITIILPSIGNGMQDNTEKTVLIESTNERSKNPFGKTKFLFQDNSPIKIHEELNQLFINKGHYFAKNDSNIFLFQIKSSKELKLEKKHNNHFINDPVKEDILLIATKKVNDGEKSKNKQSFANKKPYLNLKFSKTNISEIEDKKELILDEITRQINFNKENALDKKRIFVFIGEQSIYNNLVKNKLEKTPQVKKIDKKKPKVKTPQSATRSWKQRLLKALNPWGYVAALTLGLVGAGYLGYLLWKQKIN